jgi:hypothetical protein
VKKHTPGPWRVGGSWWNSDAYPAYCVLPVETCEGIGSTIAELSYSGPEPGTSEEQQAEADARLIAAAPDLLEACRDALDFLHAIPDPMPKLIKHGYLQTESTLGVAIAKAEEVENGQARPKTHPDRDANQAG